MLRRWGTFRRDKSGLAAVEFALILPLMIALFFGVEELSLALSCRANVVNVASTTADLVAQQSTITAADIKNVFKAANAILYPFNPSVAQITLTSVIYDTANPSLVAGKVDWSRTQGGTAHGLGTTMTLPAGLMVAGQSVIVAEITYPYTSPTLKFVKNQVWQNTFYTKPRRVASIPCPDCT
jgi:Flp pilus assembly protein TadG